MNQVPNPEAISMNEQLVMTALGVLHSSDLTPPALYFRIVAETEVWVDMDKSLIRKTYCETKEAGIEELALIEVELEAAGLITLSNNGDVPTVTLTAMAVSLITSTKSKSNKEKARAKNQEDASITSRSVKNEIDRLITIAAGNHADSAIELKALYLRVLGQARGRGIVRVTKSEIGKAMVNRPDSNSKHLIEIEDELISAGLIVDHHSQDVHDGEPTVSFADEPFATWLILRNKGVGSSAENMRDMREGMKQRPSQAHQRPDGFQREFDNQGGEVKPVRKDILDANITVFGLSMSFDELQDLVVVIVNFFNLTLRVPHDPVEGFEDAITYRGTVITVSDAYILMEQIENNPHLANFMGPLHIGLRRDMREGRGIRMRGELRAGFNRNGDIRY